MRKIEIRRLNQFNFILAERLEVPVKREIAGSEVVYTHKNIDKFYGTLYAAIRGYFKHLGINTPTISKSLELVKPSSPESLFIEYMERDLKELLEIFYKDKNAIKYMKEQIVEDYFANKKEISEHNTIDSICDTAVFSINEVELKGYDFDLAMSETIKEISSREQCPMQKEVWDKWKPSGKRQKNTSQDKATLYTADYENCKKNRQAKYEFSVDLNIDKNGIIFGFVEPKKNSNDIEPDRIECVSESGF